MRVNVHYWNGLKPLNFGEALVPLLLRALGHEAVWVPLTQSNKLIMVGSFVDEAQDQDLVWGAGVARDQIERFNSNAAYRAVRGPRTARLMFRAGVTPPTVRCDPISLCPLFINRDIGPSFATGIVPHWSDYAKVAAIPRPDGVTVINVRGNDPLVVARKIWACERILASSLHAIVFAHAYGIPACWVAVHGKIAHGDGAKYRDYLEGVGLGENCSPWDLKKLDGLDNVECALPVAAPNTKAMLAAFPYC